MISVIIYGRNDAHGYNGHRRVALSLNCIAEVLTDAGDEIVFTDYNTPDELPTLIEALADTLTPRCRSLIRVLRVGAEIHERQFAARTPMHVVEPVARNVAVRRTNPSNRWLLSTTTDMLILPLGDESLSEICSTLPDGFYGLPRFELPEWLWESLPRTDPGTAIASVARLGPLLRLDEITVSYDWIRFDAPGDFQLMLRDDFFAIDGFDEEMILGWHVDSNLSKRLVLHRGSIESLEDSVAGYHCNHLRTPTIFQTSGVVNDLSRFVYSLDQVRVPAQNASWGLAETSIDEVRVHEHYESDFVDAVTAASTWSAERRVAVFDARDTKFALEYDSGHVMPFLADSIRVLPGESTIAYVGANPVLEKMLAELVAGRHVMCPRTLTELEVPESLSELDRLADVFVIDLGVDASLFDSPLSTASGDAASRCRTDVVATFDAFRRIVEFERARLAAGVHARRFVLVNSTPVFWNSFVLAHMWCSPTTPHARVRQAIVRTLPDESDEAKAADARALRLVRWMSRREECSRLDIAPGSTVAIADLDDYAGFGNGWAFPDRAGLWTEGSWSELSIATNGSHEATTLTLWLDEIAVGDGGSVEVILRKSNARVAALETAQHGAQGDVLDALQPTLQTPGAWLRARARALGLTRIRVLRSFYYRGSALGGRILSKSRRVPSARYRWNVELPASAVTDGTIDVALRIEPGGDWYDKRRRGLYLTAIGVQHSRSRSVWPLRLVRRPPDTTRAE